MSLPDRPIDGRERIIAGVLRDWIHETPLSQCNMGSDTCDDWPLANGVAARIEFALMVREQGAHADAA